VPAALQALSLVRATRLQNHVIVPDVFTDNAAINVRSKGQQPGRLYLSCERLGCDATPSRRL